MENRLITQVSIGLAGRACQYNLKSVTVDLKVNFDGRLGAGSDPAQRAYFSLPFFVAVMEPGGNILAKEVFAATLAYPSGAQKQTYTENLRQIIPIANTARGPRYKVKIGFQLSPDQLKYNRAAIKRLQVIKDMQKMRQNTQILRSDAPLDLQPVP
jgi:hypothetical protein